MKPFNLAIAIILLATQPVFAADAVQPKKAVSEEKLAIDFFAAMCLKTGGKTAKIEERLGKAVNELDKKTIVGNQYSMEQTEDIWAVPNSVSKEPYILSVTKSGICYVGLNASNAPKLKQDFKAFVSAQAAQIKSVVEKKNPDVEIPDGMDMDFYDVKIPRTNHVIKFSLAVPEDSDPAVRSTMTIASE